MPMTKEQILAEAKALDPKAREELIEDLRQVVDDDELTPEQRAELRRRVAELQRGEATLVPGDQVMRELREHLGGRGDRPRSVEGAAMTVGVIGAAEVSIPCRPTVVQTAGFHSVLDPEGGESCCVVSRRA